MNQKLTVRDMAWIALGAALIAICSWISVPSPLPSGVPFTLQTFAVCLLAALYGWRKGLWTVGCYLLLGAVGVPVFAGFKGSVGALLGVTGGYLVGFLFTALVIGLAADKLGRRLPVLLGAMVLGLALCYAFGTVWFLQVYTSSKGPMGVGAALGLCVLPYLLPDGIKILLAALLTGRLYPLLMKGTSP